MLHSAPLPLVRASVGRPSIVIVTTQALHVTRVRVGTAINKCWALKQSVSRLCKKISTGNVAVKAVTQIGTIATTAVDLPSVCVFFLLCIRRNSGGSLFLLVVPKLGKTFFNADCTLPVSFSVSSHSDPFVALLLFSWRPSVPSGARVPQLEDDRLEECARPRSPRHTRCLAKRVAAPSL